MIVETVGTAVGCQQGPSALVEALEAAMVGAIHQAIEDGVSLSDVEEILRRKAVAAEQARQLFEVD